MTALRRMLNFRSSAVGRTVASFGLLAAVVTALGLGAAPAGAVVSGTFGLQKRTAPTVVSAPLQYHGGQVLHSSDSYAIYWDPTGVYRGDWKQLINGYFHNVGVDSGQLSNIFSLDGQYTDATGRANYKSTFRGSYTDTTPYPTTANCSDAAAIRCLTDSQIKAELFHVITSVAPPLPGATGTPVYYLFTPPGVTVCTDGGGNGNCSDSTAVSPSPPDGLCGYHSVINPVGAGATPYVVQPWVAGNAGQVVLTENPLTTSDVTPDVLACQDDSQLVEPHQLSTLNPFGNYAQGLADVIINDLSIEQQNVVTNPFLNGWYQTSTSNEQADMCRWNFGPPPTSPPAPEVNTHSVMRSNQAISNDTYYLQWAFNSVGFTSGKGYTCWSGASLVPHFTSPNPVNSGDIVGFDATESNIALLANTTGLPANEPFTATTYKWDFGDGNIVTGANAFSEFHSYTYGGTYTVTLTVNDSASNTAEYSQDITVDGPPAPAAPPTGSTTAAPATTSTSPSDAASSTGSTTHGLPDPVASAAASGGSLQKALKQGLTVRYRVNEQVAGHFEVLLDRSVANHLGIHGPAPAGMPAGATPTVVIAKAILITTKSGRSSVRIQFSKATAKRMKRLRKVKLTLRLIVRNASTTSPKSVTVVSTVQLHR